MPMEPTAPTPWRVLESPAGDEQSEPGRRSNPPPTSGERSIPLRAVLIGALAVACAVGAILLASTSGAGTLRVEGGVPLEASESAAPGMSPGDAAVASGGDLVVEIVGAVRRPGVYRLPDGSRVADLVDAAGGFGPRIDTAATELALNLAARLHDGERIRVPSRGDDAPASSSAGGPATTAASLVHVNRATQAELEALPGIGPATAQKIIAAREEAPFAATEELRSRGILGEKTFEKLRDLITVG
jgi:competence protein ComEA